jgi:DNA sulfur modification protein DndD
MKNFGPYKGEHKIEFKTKSGKNLSIIWGKNGAGKTHIMKAMLWCLYGCDPTLTKKKQYGTEKDAWEFIYGAHLEDQPLPDPYMHVYLFLEEGPTNDSGRLSQYVVKRSVFPQSPNPMNPSQIRTDFEVIKDGRRSDSPREEIEALLPLAASQFFMFHGEEIRQMSQKHAEETHKAIELILEAETFRQGKEDLSAVAREIEQDLDDERRRSGGMDDLLDLKKRTRERIDSIEIDISNCKNEIADLKKELDGVKAELERNESSQVLQVKLNSLEQQLKDNEEQREKIVNQRDDLINELPAKMILPELRRIQTEKEKRQLKREGQEREIAELRGNLKLANEIVKADKCKLCGRTITEQERLHIQQEINYYDGEISRLTGTLEEEDPTYYEIRETVAGIERSKLDFEQFKMDLDENTLSHDELESQIKDVKKQLTDSKSEEVRTLMARRDSLLIAIGASENKQDNFQRQLDDQQKALNNVLKLIEDKDKHDNIKENLERQSDLIERCITAFESVLNNLSEVRRKAIADYATEVFRMLTNKPEEYDRIEIDQQFNVSVMDKRNNIVHREDLSTGERLVVALSFILGLKQASEKIAPLVLDTFFAHLDEEHFGNIVKALPNFADQVVLILTNLEYKNLKEMAPKSFFDHTSQIWQVIRNKHESRSEIALCEES